MEKGRKPRTSLGIIMEEEEYTNRFVACLIRYYGAEIELHQYSDWDQWKHARKEGVNHQVLLIDEAVYPQVQDEDMRELKSIMVVLGEDDFTRACAEAEEREANQEMAVERKNVYWIRKYQEVNHIMDAIWNLVAKGKDENEQGQRIGTEKQLYGVYSLEQSGNQLPYAVTLGAILAEKESVLLIDLQENSGLRELSQKSAEQGLEEMLVMTMNHSLERENVLRCMERLEGVDYIFPPMNSEIISEMDGQTYQKMLEYIMQELDYSVVILNFGTRFQGFFEVANMCDELFLLQVKGRSGSLREAEFQKEIERRGYYELQERIHRVMLPGLVGANVGCERLIEKWKWDPIGDHIRAIILGVKCG